MKLGLRTELIAEEINAAAEILRVWHESSTKMGIPGVDNPASTEEIEHWIRNFRGEMLLVADKCQSLADRIIPGV